MALFTFWLPLMTPLARAGKMTCSHDGALYLLRAFQLDALVQRGILWPRWSPGMVFGYGYPLFNFHPVLSMYPVVILHEVGLSLLHAWNLALGLGMLASGLFTYVWARSIVGQRGAFVAAIAFMFAPYQLYDVYWRGNVAESLSLPLLPAALWAALRVAQAQERSGRYIALGALTYAAILLTHPAASLIFTPLLLAYAAMGLWTVPNRRAPAYRALAWRLAAMLALGLGLAAFFLIPAYLEKGQVQFWLAITSAGSDFHNHFVTLGELFSPPQASDPLLINPSPLRSLGLAAGALAVLGAAATWWNRDRLGALHKRHVWWAGLSLAVVIIMMLPISEPLWARAPLLPFVQYPWRFLGMGSLLAALLAGAGMSALEHSGVSRGLTAIAGVGALLLIFNASPWDYPRLCAAPENHTQASFVAYEKGAGLIGTTAFGEYLPEHVDEFPTTSPMVEPMLAGQPVVRWDAPGARILDARDDGLNAELTLESDAPVQVTYRAFYFPGWQADVDGQRVPLKIVSPSGVMAVDVPAGRHTLRVRFQNTPLRAASEFLSAIAAAMSAALWVYDWRSTRRNPHTASGAAQAPRPAALTMSTAAWLGLAALGAALLAFKLGIAGRYDTPLRWRRLQDNQLRGAMYTTDAIVAGRARLLGYDVRPERAAAGDVLFADLYWRLSEPLKFRATLRLLDERGLEWSYKDEIDTALVGYSGPPPSQEWPPGAYAKEYHAIRILPGAPPGEYLLAVTPFAPDTLEPLPITSGQPAPGGYPGLVAGKLQVALPAHPPSAGALDLAVPTNAPLGPDLTIVGYSLDRTEIAPGERMRLLIGWQARRQPQADYAVQLELVGPDGQTIAQTSLAPGGGYATSHWRAGEVILSQALPHVPGRAASGPHTWRVTLLDSNAAPPEQAELGTVQVIAPQRVFDAPAVSHRLEARLGEWVELTGFDAPGRIQAGQALSVTLVWRALGESDVDYKTFVHLLDAGGQLAAQSDAVPAGWTRPTSGWQSGEFVTDVHALNLERVLPPGEYRLIAGMYNADGRRLPAVLGGDAIDLGNIQLTAP